MQLLASWLLNTLAHPTDLAQTWNQVTQVCLWGNKCDLSISAGSQKAASGDPVAGLDHLASHIMVNHGEEAWAHLVKKESKALIDIVMDNSGYELFTDLCLADFLVSSGIATVIRFRIKDQPWFVSDTTPKDFSWTMERLATSNDPGLKEVGNRWKNHLEEGRWTTHSDSFWTYPHTFCQMSTVDSNLYNTLSEADLIIFKGDLNYRKLVGDLNWETTAPFLTALQGFLPAPILSLRTSKADVMVGLEPGQAEETSRVDPNWMVNGEWGVVQYATP